MPMVTLPGTPGGPDNTYSAASGTINLYDPGTATVGRWIIDVAITVGTAAITVTKRVKVGGGITPHTPANCWYTNALTNTAATAGTTITANGVYDIDATGCDVILTYTTAGSGVIELFATPVMG